MITTLVFWQFCIAILFLMIFLAVFLPLRYGKGITFCILAACFFITGIMNYLYLIIGKRYETSAVFTVAEIFVLQIVPFVISEYRDFRAMFVGFTASSYVSAGSVFCSVMYIAGADVYVSLGVQFLVELLLLGILKWRVRESFLYSLGNPNLPWGKLCLIPAMFYTAIHTTSMWPANIYKRPENIPGMCSIMVLMVISYIMVIQMFARQKQDSDRQRSVEYLESYARHLKQEADTVQEKETEIAVVRHDLKHYSILINSYLEEGKKAEIKALLKELNDHVNEARPVRYCENLAVNGIVAHCAKQAKNLGVRFEAAVEIPQKMRINEFEFGTVLANLLENAMNAASQTKGEKRFVKLEAHIVKEQLILSISNGCEKDPSISKISGLPVSDRGEGHGYGMQSVQAFVNKNGAVFDFTMREGIFSVKMLVRI